MSWHKDEDRDGTGTALGQLAVFRGELCLSLGMGRDALFEACDAVLCKPGRVLMLAELCLKPECRRGHGAVCDALNCGEIGVARLRRALSGLPLPTWPRRPDPACRRCEQLAAPRRGRQPGPVNLAGVLTDCSRRPAPCGVSLRIGHLERVFVLGDETQLSRVVSNLVDNALRYAATIVELSVHVDSGHAVVCVSDDGPGIPQVDRDRIWERFTRLDDDRSRLSGGSGLGLAMVSDLTAAHGGTVSVASRRPRPGAVFQVRLPTLTA